MVSFSPHCASSSLYCQVSCQRSKELSLRASHPCGSPSVVNLCPGPCIPRPFVAQRDSGGLRWPPECTMWGLLPRQMPPLSCEHRAPLVSDGTRFLCLPEARRPVPLSGSALAPSAVHHNATRHPPETRVLGASPAPAPLAWPPSASPLCLPTPYFSHFYSHHPNLSHLFSP